MAVVVISTRDLFGVKTLIVPHTDLLGANQPVK